MFVELWDSRLESLPRVAKYLVDEHGQFLGAAVTAGELTACDTLDSFITALARIEAAR